jgi:glycosyltransferase involved in cell wall biosynthesis
MKVLIVTGIFPPDSGGPASYVPAFAQQLASENEVVSVVTLSDHLEHDDSFYNFPVVRLARAGNKISRRLRTIMKIARLLRGADVVYLNGLVLEGVIAARMIRCRPIVIKVVGDMIWEQARNQGATNLDIDAFQRPGSKPMIWRVLRLLQSTYMRAADHVITPSKYLAGIVTGWGGAPERIRVVLNAVQPPSDNASHEEPEFDIVTVGRLVPWKGIDSLIDVCAERSWSLLVVGDGPQRCFLEARAASSGARVSFSGEVPKQDVTHQIRRARVFVLNSSYEGLPHIVLEAKLAGRPVVATRVGGTPETIHDLIDGYLVEPDDSAHLAAVLARLLGDPRHRAMITEAGLTDVRARFSFDVMYRDTIAVLEEAIKDSD